MKWCVMNITHTCSSKVKITSWLNRGSTCCLWASSSWDFDKTFTDLLLPRTATHIFQVLWFDHFSRNNGPLFFLCDCNCEILFFLVFSRDFYKTFMELLLSRYPMHVVKVLWFDIFWRNYGPLFILCICNI